MIGIDTSFLVAYEVAEHPKHHKARDFAAARCGEGFALAPQVLPEFIHIITDERRLERPVPMSQALELTEKWRDAVEVRLIPPTQEACLLFTALMAQHRLGRKRLLDTLLSATYLTAGVHTVVTLDVRDFAMFAGFAPIIL